MDSLRAETGTTEPLNKRQRCEDGDANLIESCNRGEDCEGGGRSAECDGASSSPQTGAEAGPAAGREASTSGTPSAAGSQKPGEDAAKQQEQKLGRRARRRKAKPGLEAMQKLNAACRAQSPALGMEAFDELLKLQEAGTLRLKLQQYNNLMYLCSGGANWQEYAHRQDGGLDAQRVRTCFRMVVDSGFTPNEMTYTALARVAALEGDGQAALAAVKDMMAAGVDDGPKLRSFHPAMRVFASQGRVQLMEEVDRMIAEQNLDLTELEFSLLLEASVRAGSYAQVCAVLHRMSRELTALQSDTLAQLQEYFRGERAAHAFAEGAELCGRGATWQVVETQVDEQGRSCHSPHALQRIEIEPKDWQEFLKGIDQLAQSRAGSMDAWLRFLKWLQRNGPYSIVIDGANVALFNQNFVGGGFSWEQIDRLVQKLQRDVPDQRPLVFLHTNRCQNEDASTPYAQAVISRLRAQRMLFATPPGCNDDWFWMYAAVKAGPRGWLISNDEMRDHIYQLLRPKYFLKWRQQHQVNFQWLSPEPTLLHPPAYSTCVQQLPDGSWMLPGHAGRWLLAKPIEAAP